MKKILYATLLVLCYNSAYAQGIAISKIGEYALPEGYDCTILSVQNPEIVITCPRTYAFYYLAEGEKEFKEVRYRIGRGPDELNRAPFGVAILENEIVFADTDLQRFFKYNKNTEKFSVQTIKVDGGLHGINSTRNNSVLFLKGNSVINRGVFYNYYTGEETIELLYPEQISSVFEADGAIYITDNFLFFGSLYHGYVSSWDVNTGEFYKKWIIYNPGNTRERSANMGGMSGFIPPATDIQLLDVASYHIDNKLYLLLLIQSKNDKKYVTDRLYVFDTEKNKITSNIKLESEADMFDLSGNHLYVHYNELDKLVEYNLSVK